MDEAEIIDKFKWFCKSVGGMFDERVSYSAREAICKGHLGDFKIETHLLSDGAKDVFIAAEHRGIDIHIDGDEYLEVETAFDSDINIRKVNSVYRDVESYDQQFSRIIAEEVNKISLEIHENGLNVFIS